MTVGTMLKDILESFFKKSSTQLYPYEKVAPPERYRGSLTYNPSTCTGCSLCVKDCPSQAIELVILDRAAKRYVLKYHRARCIYCGQCVADCKPKCMGMSNQDWEHAVLDQEFIVYEGRNEDIVQYLESLTAPVAEQGK